MKPTYSNDRKAPRTKKGQFSTQVITKDLWKSFIKEFPEHKNMKWDEFFQYWKDIAETARQEIIINPLGIKLAHYSGEIKLNYLPHKFKAIDPAEGTKYMNIITRGKVAKIKWERRWAVKFNKMLQFFAFVPNRELKPKAKQQMDSNPDNVRVSRNTLGGHSIWRQLK